MRIRPFIGISITIALTPIIYPIVILIYCIKAAWLACRDDFLKDY